MQRSKQTTTRTNIWIYTGYVFLLLSQTVTAEDAAAAAVGTSVASLGTNNTTAVPSPETTCWLRLIGYGDRGGIKQARLSCQGGTITVAASPELMQALDTNRGVALSRNGSSCHRLSASMSCMLVVCNSTAAFISPLVTALKVTQKPLELDRKWVTAMNLQLELNSSSKAIGWMPDGSSVEAILHSSAVCITGGSRVRISNGSFSRSLDIRPLTVVGTSTVHLDQCRFANNAMTTPSEEEEDVVVRSGGALFVAQHAKVTIQASTFAGNQAGRGGAICIANEAVVEVWASMLGGTDCTLSSA